MSQDKSEFPEVQIRINEGPLVIDEDRLVNMLDNEGARPAPMFVKLGGNLTGRAFQLDHLYDWTLVKDSHGFIVLVPLKLAGPAIAEEGIPEETEEDKA